jgi:Ca2+-binding EF-hand superfamily protein
LYKVQYLRRIAAENGLKGPLAETLINLFDSWDLNGDGRVEAEEFAEFW